MSYVEEMKKEKEIEAAEPKNLCELPPVLPRIYDGPASLPRSLTDEEVKIHRDVLCPRYSLCLMVAAKWTGFTCLGCPSMGKGKIVRKLMLEEIIGSRK